MGSRRALIASLLLLAAVILGIAALQLPALLDMDARRPQLAAIASERLGRPVALDGPIRLTLLPQPRLEAEQVTIGRSADAIGITTRALRLRLDLGALLLGRLAVRELSLVGAEIRLPWPPTALPGLAPPRWLTALDARLEQSRLQVGDLVLEGVQARLVALGASEALTAEGAFSLRGSEARFTATLGRAGDDGVAPLDLELRSGLVTASARGVLLAAGGFEGRLEAVGPDLGALLPSPPGAFRATAVLAARAEQLSAANLNLDLAGQRLAGAAALRWAPQPRLDLTLAAARLDLVPWMAALRGGTASALPISLDLAAEAAAIGPLRLRRLRGAAFLEGERLSLSDVVAELPGEGRLEASGASAGPRLDLALRVQAAQPALLLEGLGLPTGLPVPPGALGGQARLSVEGAQLSASNLVASWGDARLTGGLVWRQGPRPSLALGLEADALVLPIAAPALAARLADPGMDLSLRLGLGHLALADTTWERVTLDGAAENGRIVLRRLAARHLGLELALAGTLAQGRLSDGTLEAEGAVGPLLERLGMARPGFAAAPLRLRATVAGPREALALRLESELAEARIGLQTVLDLVAGRSQGALTLRHPGAARLLAVLHPELAFVGDGSLSLVASLATRPGGWSADAFDLVAGQLRGSGQLALTQAARPALSGRLALERLPLPAWTRLLAWPDLTRGLDLDLALRAEQVEPAGLPPLEQASAVLRADAGTLRLENLRAQLAGGALAASLRQTREQAGGERPALEAEASLTDAVLPGPLTGRPLDLVAGRVSASGRLAAQGHSHSALLASLMGQGRLTLRDAILQGLDANAAAGALNLGDTAQAEAALRAAFRGGATAVERATLDWQVEAGQASVTATEFLAEGGLDLSVSGQLDLLRDVLDMRFALPAEPPVALRLVGPSLMPRRLPELADWLRNRAQ